MVDRSDAQAATAVDAVYHAGTIALPAHVREEWNARGVQRVRVTPESGAVQDDEFVRAIIRTQRCERDVAVALAAAAGTLAGTTFAGRVQRVQTYGG